jgi:tRNA(Ile)-lysidine synthase
MNSLELRLEKYIQRQRLLSKGQHVLLAVSGGVDSIVMLQLFQRLSKWMNLKLSVIHVNHQLRGRESEEDENFVVEKCKKDRITYFIERVNVITFAHKNKLTKQHAARQLRYECFERIRKKIDAQVVATAHHADDNIETVLLNVIRGTGIHGLAGIPVKRDQGHIIRPLLFARRKEIEKYANEFGICFRNDSSNNSTAYRRNFLRHKLLPALHSKSMNIDKIYLSISRIMSDVSIRIKKMLDERIPTLFQQESGNLWKLNLERLSIEPEFLRNEIFVELFHRIQIEPTEKRIQSLSRLSTLPSGRSISLSGDLVAFRDRGLLIFRRTDSKQHISTRIEYGKSYHFFGQQVFISKPESVPIATGNLPNEEYIDAERLGSRLLLRSWQTGDWFIPLGMNSKKKVSDYFTDQKIPRYLKPSIPILESDGKIVWICGKRLDDRFKLTKHTRTAIRLTYQPSI